MTRKDYIALGKVLAGQWATASPKEKGVIWCITLSMADVFKQDNVRFDRSRFYNFVLGTDQYEARKQCVFS